MVKLLSGFYSCLCPVRETSPYFKVPKMLSKWNQVREFRDRYSSKNFSRFWYSKYLHEVIVSVWVFLSPNRHKVWKLFMCFDIVYPTLYPFIVVFFFLAFLSFFLFLYPLHVKFGSPPIWYMILFYLKNHFACLILSSFYSDSSKLVSRKCFLVLSLGLHTLQFPLLVSVTCTRTPPVMLSSFLSTLRAVT